MATRQMATRKAPTRAHSQNQNARYAPTRSVRVSQPVWDKAKGRAKGEDKTMSAVVALLLEAYAEKLIDLPTTKLTYSE